MAAKNTKDSRLYVNSYRDFYLDGLDRKRVRNVFIGFLKKCSQILCLVDKLLKRGLYREQNNFYHEYIGVYFLIWN